MRNLHLHHLYLFYTYRNIYIVCVPLKCIYVHTYTYVWACNYVILSVQDQPQAKEREETDKEVGRQYS